MELRFVEKAVDAPEHGNGIGKIVKILQYRCMEPFGSWGKDGQPPMRMGEWRDVPCVPLDALSASEAEGKP